MIEGFAWARAAFVAFFLGEKLEYTYEFIRYEEGKLLAMTTEYSFEAAGDEGQYTKLTLRNHGEPSGLSKTMAPMLSRAMRKANENDLANVRRILESR